MKTRISRLLSISLSILCMAQASAEPAADSQAASAEKTKTQQSSPDASKNSALQGNVKSVEIEAAEALRQMGDCLKKIERAGLELMGEATRQDYIAVGDPDVIGTMIIPAIPPPTGMMAIGPYLPIREKMMDYYLDQIGKLIPIYAEYADALVMPDSTKAQSSVLLKQMAAPFDDARARYMELMELSKDIKNGHNQKIAEISVILHDDMQKIDKLRVQVFQLLKNEEKSHK